MDLALNNQQRLICHKTVTTNQPQLTVHPKLLNVPLLNAPQINVQCITQNCTLSRLGSLEYLFIAITSMPTDPEW